MVKTFFLNLIIYVFILIAFRNCNKDDKSNNLFHEIADITTIHGNLNSDIIVVNTQGGPITQLEDETLQEFIAQTQTASALYVNVHQAQTKEPNQFLDSEITFEEAKQFDDQSVGYLKKVLDYFQAKGKTVYVLGISFGAFMTQELIAKYGINVADRYLIMVGRLNIDEHTWGTFSQGEYVEYLYDNDGSYTITSPREGANIEQRNMARLAAGLGFNRYMDRLKSVASLSKVTYVYGNRDEQVGPLSIQEIQFLENKGATLILSDNGNHAAAIETGLNILKQTFGIK